MSDARRVMAAIIAALFLEMVAGLLWVGGAAHRIEHLENQLADLSSVEIRAARLEEQTTHLQAAIARIEGKLDAALRQQENQ